MRFTRGIAYTNDHPAKIINGDTSGPDDHGFRQVDDRCWPEVEVLVLAKED